MSAVLLSKLIRSITFAQNDRVMCTHVPRSAMTSRLLLRVPCWPRWFRGELLCSIPPPAPPTTCCMSGCANCVWIDHAEELVRFYRHREQQDALDVERLLDEVDEGIQDEMVRAFVKTEIRSMVMSAAAPMKEKETEL